LEQQRFVSSLVAWVSFVLGACAFLFAGLAGLLSLSDARAPSTTSGSATSQAARTGHAGEQGPAARRVELQLLGVNDLHGHLEPSPPERRSGRRVRTGGVAWLAGHLDRAERGYPGRTLRVHSGDMVGASPLVSSHFHDEPTIKALNLLRFDAGTLGNHELDEGAGEFRRLLSGGRRVGPAAVKRGARGRGENTSDPAFAGVGFPYVAANTVDGRGRALLPPYTIVERAGARIGFIGVTTRSAPDFLLARHASGVRFLDLSAAVNRQAQALRRRGVEAIVVLAHAGGFERGGGSASGEIIRETRQMSDAVDVVVAGHSHSVLDTTVPNRRGGGGKLVVEAAQYGVAYDRVLLTVDRASGHVVDKRADVRPTWHDQAPPERRLAALTAGYAARSAELARRMLGRAGEDLRRHKEEATPSGDLGAVVADAQRALGRADVALVDPVSIRASLQSGPVTYSDVFEVAPYEHPIVRIRVTGADLRDLLERQAARPEAPELHASGLRYDAGHAGSGANRRAGVSLSDGRPLDPRRTYSLAVSEQLLSGKRFSLPHELHGAPEVVGTELDALVAWFEHAPGRSP